MKIGLIGRADNRGIGYQTLEFWRHMGRDDIRTLVVLMDERGWPEDVGRFGKNVTYADSNLSPNLEARGTFDERRVRKFLQGLDVVFAVETVYDWRFIDWAHDEGVRVVIQGNPEFYAHHHHPEWPHPDVWAWPTPWMRDQLPDGVELPVPCAVRPQTVAPVDSPTLNVLHVIGRMAANDRNGSLDFIESIPTLRQKVKVRVVTQDGELPRPKIRHGANVEVEVITGGVDDRWSMYEDQHLLVLPRRYGGLCLPALEAMSTGMAVLMTDCSPNEIWPGPRVKARKGRVQRSPFGKIQCWATHPIDIAHEIDALARFRDRLAEHLEDAQRFAELNSWDELRDRLYIPVLSGESA